MLHSFPFVSHLTVPQDSFSLGCYLDNFLYHLLSPFDSRRIKTQVLDFRTSPSGSVVKNLPTIQEMKVPSLDQEDLLEEGVITHSGILAWRIPWTQEPGRLQSVGLQRVGAEPASTHAGFQDIETASCSVLSTVTENTTCQLGCWLWSRALSLALWNHLASENHLVVSDCLQCHGLYSPWNSPGQNTGVGSLSVLQGIVPTQGLNTGLPNCRWTLYQLSHQENLRIFWSGEPIPSAVDLSNPGIELGSPVF